MFKNLQKLHDKICVEEGRPASRPHTKTTVNITKDGEVEIHRKTTLPTKCLFNGKYNLADYFDPELHTERRKQSYRAFASILG